MIDYHKEKIETEQQLIKLLIKFKQKELCWLMLFIERYRIIKEGLKNWEKWCDLGLQYMQGKNIAYSEFRILQPEFGIEYIQEWNDIEWFQKCVIGSRFDKYGDESRIFTAKTDYVNKNWNNFIHD